MKKLCLVSSLSIFLIGFLGLSTVSHAQTISYGNGLYCKKNGCCWVNKNEMWRGVGHIMVNGWLEHGPWANRGR